MCNIRILILFVLLVIQPSIIPDEKLYFPYLSAIVWKEKILIHLECMDLDYALCKDEPLALMFIGTRVDEIATR